MVGSMIERWKIKSMADFFLTVFFYTFLAQLAWLGCHAWCNDDAHHFPKPSHVFGVEQKIILSISILGHDTRQLIFCLSCSALATWT